MIETLDQLLALLTTMSQTYERAKKEGDFDFFEVVQPFAEKVDQTLDQFKTFNKEVVRLPYMNQNKFDLLIENMKVLSVECHFQRTSRKLFTEKLKATHYDLNYIKRNEL
ncbi:DUF1798 family protein [Staphylococcus auricularis]|uniref:DUF1798 family protein n=1 Tax=Staphylococcus auricularis TaxID=29379 RepID=UPI0024306C91|nr:DUF1798 family protein [Staphylococcus auricularis]